jgi:hypothetical protein
LTKASKIDKAAEEIHGTDGGRCQYRYHYCHVACRLFRQVESRGASRAFMYWHGFPDIPFGKLGFLMLLGDI